MSSEIKIDLSNDLMNMDLTNVQTVFPLLNPGIYTVKVSKIEMVDNKEKSGKNIRAELQLTQEAEAVAENQPVTVKPGYQLYHTISLVQTDKYDPRQKLAQFMECFLGTKAGNFMPLEQFLNREGTVKTNIDKGNDTYGPSVKIDRLVKKS